MKPLRFNAFVMNTNSHIHHGQWRHPDALQADFNDVHVWIDLVKRLESGLFDAVFFADVVGLYGPAGGNYDVNVREGLQIPSNDPLALLSALAVNTEHLGLALTSSILQQHPFNFARQISTLDHISNGRIGWNVVTGTLDNGARNFDADYLEPHDERYRWADEYVDVTYKLWEGSWDDGALLKDRDSGIYADVSKVHRIHHRGPRYRVDGPHLPSPSRQRTPLIYQAGGSDAGKAFAARNAEGIFIIAPTPEIAAKGIQETRQLAVEAGRQPDDVQFYQGMAFVIGSTEEEAKRREAELEEYVSVEGYTAHMDFAAKPDGTLYPPDTPLSAIETNASKGLLAWLKQSITDHEPVVADVGQLLSRRRIVGTPEQIADELTVWQQAGVDGINMFNWRIPDSYQEFIDHVMPVLRERGLAQTEYAPGTLRNKLTGSDLVNERHPAARYRGAFSPQLAEPDFAGVKG
jgi:long-chain alkane monooxygenase